MSEIAISASQNEPTDLTLAPSIFDTLIPDWLISADVAPNTQIAYQRGLTMFTRWLKENPQQINGATIRQFRDAMRTQYSAATVNAYLSAVRSFFGYLVETGRIPTNPAASVKGATRRGTSSKHKRDELTSGEVRQVLAVTKGDSLVERRDHAIIALMAYCGVRQVEIQRADIGDVKTRNGRMVLWVQGKGSTEKDDFVVLPNSAEDALRRWRNVHEQLGKSAAPLFYGTARNRYGQRMTTRAIRNIVKGAYAAAGINAPAKTTHSLRHSAISNAIRNGASITQVQAMARHANVNTTMVYFHETSRTDAPAEDFINFG